MLTTITLEQIELRRKALAALLAELRAGKIECIEYGDPDNRHLSYLRLRFINTAGGPQYQLKTLRLGLEGSGFYTSSEEAILTEAINMIIHYHRPSSPKIQEYLEKKRRETGEPQRELRFFEIANSATKSQLADRRAQEIDEWSAKIGAQTITLKN